MRIVMPMILCLVAFSIGQERSTDFEIWMYNEQGNPYTVTATAIGRVWDEDFLITESLPGGSFEIEAYYSESENGTTYGGSDYGFVIEEFDNNVTELYEIWVGMGNYHIEVHNANTPYNLITDFYLDFRDYMTDNRNN